MATPAGRRVKGSTLVASFSSDTKMLRAAAARLRKKNGWRQKGPLTVYGNEPACAFAALHRQARDTYGENADGHAAFRRALRRVHKATKTTASVIVWNDTRGRTKAQVLAAFKRAIDAKS